MIRIFSYLLDEIQHSKPNSILPSENKLADKFRLSRHDVHKVYDILDNMGITYSKQGVGHFTKRRPIKIKLELFSNIGFSEKMRSESIPYEVKIIDNKLISSEEFYQDMDMDSENLKIEIQVIKASRLRILYGETAALHNAYLLTERFPGIQNEITKFDSIFDFYKSKGITGMHTGEKELRVIFPDNSLRLMLNCNPLVPLIELKGSILDGNNQTLQYTLTYYRSDIFSYLLT